MKAFRKFVATTIAGGILFMIPLGFIIIIGKKVLDILTKLTEPWDAKLKGEIIWGSLQNTTY